MKYLLTIILAITFQISFAQAYESKIDYNKTQQAAVVNEYSYSEQTVEKSLRDKFERMGYKIKTQGAFW